MSPKRETSLPMPLKFLAAWIGVWLGRHQQQLIEYQREELRMLREKLGGRRLLSFAKTRSRHWTRVADVPNPRWPALGTIAIPRFWAIIYTHAGRAP